ncbi:MlaD family protein [Mycolicibacterium lutetiense]|uniref:Phospholipid/cholesterol/gamma-HCH transport system substrate-binding protein n=1 Tax=Mycolicibacterium lutetiense TaxID=1641992 RepID=A0ABS4ZZ50_9MYCO|nr:MlaD family protein [Mycolicibacterium lutetiense]MBP2454789.1 phospholipid/cholesterol/gamma-HCH transport system substrate-binding protein [Mycolicibacterium lutetiense]
MTTLGALWRLVVGAVIAVILFILLANVIRQPVAAPELSYIAEFTDVSGLHKDADVRVRGVRVGKVQSVRLERRDGHSFAAVDFTLDKRYGVVSGSRLAIKYQALTGLRYVDVANPAEGYSAADLVTRVPTEMTQPSFDITALFNGLQPVIATLSPDEINTFTSNAVSYLSGDGDGLAPMLDSIHKLTRFVADRQQVIATLMRNLSAVADGIGGNSKELVQILDWINRPLDGALNAIDEFRKSELYGPEFTDTVVRLMSNLGFPPVFNAASRWRLEQNPASGEPSEVELALDRAFSNLDNYVDAFKLVPSVWENIPEPQDDAPLPCTRGRFELPAPMDVLVNGQKVVLCKR